MPNDLNSLITYAAAFIFVIALIAIGAWVLKGLLSKGGSTAGHFLRGRDRRLGVVEGASVDGRRRLILIRRDNVEHLIMTGGPVDMLIETGIKRPQATVQSPTFERRDEPVEYAAGDSPRTTDANEPN